MCDVPYILAYNAHIRTHTKFLDLTNLIVSEKTLGTMKMQILSANLYLNVEMTFDFVCINKKCCKYLYDFILKEKLTYFSTTKQNNQCGYVFILPNKKYDFESDPLSSKTNKQYFNL